MRSPAFSHSFVQLCERAGPGSPRAGSQSHGDQETLERGFEADRLTDASQCLERPWLRAAKSYPDVAGSGDKQAKAELCRVEIDEVAVAFGPPT
jgi:hypothetical protein